MGLAHNPKIVTDGLVLCLDAANPKSYPGTGTTWSDVSKNGNDGTLTNGPTYSSDNKGNFSFDGVDDYVTLNTFSFDVGNWTLEAISNSNTTYQGIITGGKFQAGLGYFCLYPNAMLLQNSTATAAIDGSHLDGNFHHLVGTVDRSDNTIKFYVDGVLKSTNTTWDGTTTTSLSVAVGALLRPAISAVVRNHNGEIPLVKIYNRALTESEIKQNFAATRGRYGI